MRTNGRRTTRSVDHAFNASASASSTIKAHPPLQVLPANGRRTTRSVDHAFNASASSTVKGVAVMASAGRESAVVSAGVTVKPPKGPEKVFKFDHRPIHKQLFDLCAEFELPYDNEDNYYILTLGSSSGAAVVRSEAQVQNVPPKMVLGLQKAADVVKQRLAALQAASSTEVAARLRNLLSAIHGDAWIADEVIESDGIKHILRAASRVVGENSEETTELAMAALCELCQFTKGQEWLEENQKEEITSSTFKQLFSVIFPPSEAATEHRAHRTPPRACLCAAHFFLQWFPSSASAAHQACIGSGSDGAKWPALYPRIVRLVDPVDSEGLAFQSGAASSLLSAMANGALETEDKELRTQIIREVITLGGEGESDALEEICKEGSFSLRSAAEHFLTSSMVACAELVAVRCSEGVSTEGGSDEQIRRMEQREKTLSDTTGKLKDKVRLQTEQMSKMMPYMKIESAQLVESSLDGIVKSGWDSIHWKRNYNLLHYCAECVEDPGVVELVALFATDINQRDDNGNRAIDFARQSGRQGVVRVLERLRKNQRGKPQAGGKAPRRSAKTMEHEESHTPTASKPHTRREDLYDRLKQLREKGGLPSSLKKAIETVLEVGWANVEWPQNFSAMHLAAKSGNVDAVELLVAANADLTSPDDWKLSPLDYAVQGQKDEVIKCLQDHIAGKGVSPSGGGGGGGGGGGHSSSGGAPSKPKASRPAPTEPNADERKKLVIPEGLRPELTRACEAVIRKGWSKIKWPHDFTAVHLAARLGSGEVVKLLIEATAWPDLQKKDDKGLTPLDYAKEKKHEEVQSLLEKAINWCNEPDPNASSATGGKSVSFGEDPSPATEASANAGPADAAGLAPGSDDAALRTGRSQTAGGGLGLSAENFDLLTERIKATERDPQELGLQQLRAELEKLRVEKGKWQQERQNLYAAIPGGEAKGVTDVGGGGAGGRIGGGPLDEGAMVKYLTQLQTFGQEAVAMKLMEPPTSGGMSLDQTDALRALEQLDMLLRVASNIPGGLSGGGGGGGGAGGGGAGPEAPADAAPAAKGKGKGKGKGPGKPGAEPAADAAVEAPAADAAPAGKGKGKAKGPGKGPGKPGAEPAAEPAAAGAPAGKGKGPGKGPGKGGPPAPGAKGPGKGPAAPGAKGAAGAKGGKDAKGGKGGAKGPEPAKPKITPKSAMRSLWWTKYQLDVQIKKGETIWDEVTDDMNLVDEADLVLRFAKSATAPKEKPKKEGGGEKKEEVKLLRIITDPNVVVGKEASLKQCPPAQECARALEELDDASLNIDLLSILAANACPTAPEMKQLHDARKAQPNIPMALPEQYMWVIGNLPAYQQRIDCWMFVRTYAERQESYQTNLEQFKNVVQCFLDSECLVSLLGMILAVGNYLNGGTNRGQADGFDVETLGKLEAIKGGDGKDIRFFIFETYFNKCEEKATALIEELAPLFKNISRRLAKDSDGTEKFAKSARVCLEDFDACVMELSRDMTAKYETMQMILQYFEDPADQFRMRMPEDFAKAKECIDDLVQLKDQCKEMYSKLLAWFKVAGMKSSEFFLNWDNLLIPGDLIVNKDEKMKKTILIPMFCQGKELCLDDLLVLWEFKDPADVKKPEQKEKKRGKKAGIRDRSKRNSKVPTSKADDDDEAPPKSGIPMSTIGEDEEEVPSVAAPAPGGKGKAPPGKGKGKAPPPAAAAAAEGEAEAAEAPAAPPAAKGSPKGKGKKGPPPPA